MVLLRGEKSESEVGPGAAEAVLPSLMLRRASLFFRMPETSGLPN